MELKALKREKLGKAVKTLRGKGMIPAVVYGKSFKNLNLTLDLDEFKKVYQGAGRSLVVDLKIEGEKEPLKVLITELQEEPIKNEVIHVDLRKVDLTQKVSVDVPIEIVGESSIVKEGQGILLALITKIKVEALPPDLPQKITVDISSLTKIGDGLSVKDLPIDQAKVKILEHDGGDLVAKIDYAVQIEKEEEVKGVEEVEVLKEKPETESVGGERDKEETETKEEKKRREEK